MELETTIQQHFIISKAKDQYNEELIQYIDSPKTLNPLSPPKTMDIYHGWESETIDSNNGSPKTMSPCTIGETNTMYSLNENHRVI